jgi:hypoxanthine phosphoribosyltransferase
MSSSSRRVLGLAADIDKVLFSDRDIQSKVTELGKEITKDYAGQPVTLVSVLKGSLMFMADLMRHIETPVVIDLMETSTYGGVITEAAGMVRILKDLTAPVTGKDVLIVEDVIDTGLTLNYLIRYLNGQDPKSLKICTLMDKPARRLVDIHIDYVGFTVPDEFVVGYGLDFDEFYRNLPFIGVLRRELYEPR